MQFVRLVIYVVAFAACLPTGAASSAANSSAEKQLPDGRVMVAGLINSLERASMHLRHSDGETVIRFGEKIKVALEANWRQLENVSDDKIVYKIHSCNQTIEFPLPAGPRSAIKPILRRSAAKDVKTAKTEGWLSAYGLRIYLNDKLPPQLPTSDNPQFIGTFSFARGRDKPAQLSVGEDTFDVSMKEGGQTHVLVFGLLATRDCQPYVNRARVIGRRVGSAVVADEIHLLPIGDQTLNDNLALPRYLFIGDSISNNYSRGLHKALEGKLNVHHPPTNCGPSAKGANSIVSWLGAYDVPGRHWDVISFNFGHWDAHNTKEDYQENLELVIKKLRETGARLVWVTTCPVPNGYQTADDLDPDGNAPGRKAGVMEKYLNPWAAEVLEGHKDIMICDQWKFVKDHENDIYKEWWQRSNVHFNGEAADELGKFLAKHVLKKLKEPRTETVR